MYLHASFYTDSESDQTTKLECIIQLKVLEDKIRVRVRPKVQLKLYWIFYTWKPESIENKTRLV